MGKKVFVAKQPLFENRINVERKIGNKLCIIVLQKFVHK